MSGYTFYIKNFIEIFTNRKFKGWGRKKTGKFATYCYEKFGGELILLEDGFIRSIDLGVNNSLSFSVVKDDIGIYYDATVASKLENILNSYNFKTDSKLMNDAKKAIEMIVNNNISKYNSSSMKISNNFLNDKFKVLVIAQTEADASLHYGMLDDYTTEDMIKAAIDENPNADIYLKIHPDVLIGKKTSDIDIENIKEICIVIEEDVNPIILLKQFNKVYTKTSQMGFEALLLGCECVCFGMPFYAGWGITDDRSVCNRRKRNLTIEEIFAASYILYTEYNNPYSKRKSDIFDVITTIIKYRQRDKKLKTDGYFFGFSLWKHAFIKPFFKNLNNINFINPTSSKNYLDSAIEKGLNSKSRIYIWGKKNFNRIEDYAYKNNIELYRVEDGFIRSVGLGSDLTQPYSLIIDRRGIYFDPNQESDLEYLLNYYNFTTDELSRARKLRLYLKEKKLSKYNNYSDVNIIIPKDKKIVLVPGQVEDDASIYFGANGMTNLELLQHARKNAKDAYIIFKPHPDVLAGNRVGNILKEDALKFCDIIVTDVSLDSVLLLCNEVHTMTSLVGFEALMRGIKVYTYGLPFYAGWGLSKDSKVCKRRKRILNIDELTAATLILYPYYIEHNSRELCEVEIVLKDLENEKNKLKNLFFYRIYVKIRNLFSRKIQQFFRIFR